jgi:sterol desaturase/sphingolipid hydroxylase (fatty acid hydroxylase superfamily)
VRGFAIDVLRLGIWLFILMAIFVPLERLFGVAPQKIFRKGFVTDLGLYFLSNLLPKAVLVFPMAGIAWALHRIVPGAVQAYALGLPMWARIAAALVVGELGFYWGHRWTHEIPWLWKFHAVHHAPEEIDWLVNSHAHPLDIVFVRLCGFVPMYALGLAQPMAGTRIDTAPLIVMLIATMWGFFIHANVRWRFGWIEWMVSTPNFHHWHHAVKHVDGNYASMLPCMDWLFGTGYVPGRLLPVAYARGSVTAMHGREDAMTTAMDGSEDAMTVADGREGWPAKYGIRSDVSRATEADVGGGTVRSVGSAEAVG